MEHLILLLLVQVLQVHLVDLVMCQFKVQILCFLLSPLLVVAGVAHIVTPLQLRLVLAVLEEEQMVFQVPLLVLELQAKGIMVEPASQGQDGLAAEAEVLVV
jgi:hypothetical protein